ncbi:methyltransferase, putative [Theileria equi strain WA]|uniref:2-methoxy-6-polyprenyl-1,4-benzoquinol methylase, mitochondrial n=1 Tax=Theileria equi strain WA TaxID=1537102 RepID=L0B348_THEEQ|nr:methyltransferase, putative [Theileria equi strain WA]AFZ81651.1 methyltransferase, putative [Theileria equi strain WA]|eukprot:XP_004831317.1 methyltransferase, putative [Theileria equi strain WA]
MIFRHISDTGPRLLPYLFSMRSRPFEIIYRNNSTNSYTSSFVRSVFSNVASNYDLMNDLMSLGIHRIWKAVFVKEVMLGVQNMIRHLSKRTFANENDSADVPVKILDLAGGTGDITFALLKHFKELKMTDSRGFIIHNGPKITPQIFVLDPSEEMVSIGKNKASESNTSDSIFWTIGEAEQMPFDDNSFDVITVAFGVRNFTDRKMGLRECYRVLKPGGRLVILEFSHCENNFFSSLYKSYSNCVIPLLGKYVANDQGAYDYLVDSIRNFPKQHELADMLTNSGFVYVSYRNLTNGIVCIHSAFKQDV